MLFVLLVLLLCLPPPACRALNYLYCSFSDNCDCDFRPNVKAELEWDLYKNVYGQHLAQDIISEEVVRFLQNKSPEKPLVLSFHGSSGTGKTLVSSMLGSHLYGSAMSSPYVHRFIPALHFPSAGQVDQYRVQLKNWVQGNLTACARSVFIFDEMERMPRGLVDVLEPFLGPSHVVFGTNYRKALYVFIRSAPIPVLARQARTWSTEWPWNTAGRDATERRSRRPTCRTPSLRPSTTTTPAASSSRPSSGRSSSRPSCPSCR
ncbi:prosalusin isoform X5 [Nerophis ophidion]|uniref:prosalusin isoform X5 n=1 Tax=Nerophis ophidion TaxID=159077 RepID=UPI002AE05CCF|nr:prosalusin isoform X5 [Nerophis ophidion]